MRQFLQHRRKTQCLREQYCGPQSSRGDSFEYQWEVVALQSETSGKSRRVNPICSYRWFPKVFGHPYFGNWSAHSKLSYFMHNYFCPTHWITLDKKHGYTIGLEYSIFYGYVIIAQFYVETAFNRENWLSPQIWKELPAHVHTNTTCFAILMDSTHILSDNG